MMITRSSFLLLLTLSFLSCTAAFSESSKSGKLRGVNGEITSEAQAEEVIEDQSGLENAATADFGDGTSKLIKFHVAMLDGTSGAEGSFVVKTRPEWAPLGAAQFEELTSVNFWEGCRIFRVLPGFVSQFGINGDPDVQSRWKEPIKDDPVATTNAAGTVVFATAGKGTRTTQIFINLDDNSFLDDMGFSPIGEVVSGMDVVKRFFSGYGEGYPQGNGPSQSLIQTTGNSYLEEQFPQLSYFTGASFVEL
mmetsp:Transcript_17692/g.26387  ORF Transcript_17692/g.26387 Transcript_17692/m.26387 type:complete len:250 (-) Transcript_17692:215-964(-)